MLAATGSTMTHAVSASSSGTCVVGRHDRVGHGGLGDAGRAGEAERGQAAPCLGEQQVAVAVVVAGELHDLASPGVAAGDADGRHRGLRAGGDQADQLHGRHPLADRLREEHLPLGRRAVGGAVDGGPLDASTIAGWAWPAMIAP